MKIFSQFELLGYFIFICESINKKKSLFSLPQKEKDA